MTTQKKRSFKSTKQRIQAQLSTDSKPNQAPIDEIGNDEEAGNAPGSYPISGGTSSQSSEELSPEEKIIQLNLEKKKSLRKIDQRRDIIGDEVAEKMKR